MTTVTDLYTRRAQTWNKAKKFLDERRDSETGCLNAEDDAAYAKMEAEIEALSGEIARCERAERLENTLAKATRAPTPPHPALTWMRMARLSLPVLALPTSGHFGMRCGLTPPPWK